MIRWLLIALVVASGVLALVRLAEAMSGGAAVHGRWEAALLYAAVGCLSAGLLTRTSNSRRGVLLVISAVLSIGSLAVMLVQSRS